MNVIDYIYCNNTIYNVICVHIVMRHISQHWGGKRSMPCQGSTAGISARALALDVWSLVLQGIAHNRDCFVTVSGLVTLLPPLINAGDSAVQLRARRSDVWMIL